MKENEASFAGFAVWSIDFDATNIIITAIWVITITTSLGVPPLQF